MYQGSIFVDAKDGYGNTLLIVATQYSNMEVVKVLLRLGANPSIQNEMGACALHFACYQNSYNVEIASLLLEHGANPNAIDYQYGCTPLHYAAGCPDSRLLLTLLNNGADVYVKDFSRYSCLDYANLAELRNNQIMILGRMGLSESDNVYYPNENAEPANNEGSDIGTVAPLSTDTIEKRIVKSLKDSNKTFTASMLEGELRNAIDQASKDGQPVPSFDKLVAEFDSKEMQTKMQNNVKDFLQNVKDVDSINISKELLAQWRTSAMLECANRVSTRMREEEKKSVIDLEEHNLSIKELQVKIRWKLYVPD